MVIFLVSCIVILFCSYLYYLLYSARNNQRRTPFTESILRSPGHSVSRELEMRSVNLLELYVVYIGGSFLGLLCFSSANTLIIKLLSLLVVLGLTVYSLKKLPALFKDVTNLRLGAEADQGRSQENRWQSSRRRQSSGHWPSYVVSEARRIRHQKEVKSLDLSGFDSDASALDFELWHVQPQELKKLA